MANPFLGVNIGFVVNVAVLLPRCDAGERHTKT